jgi:GNAT superfamily N-acetyltransferase
MDMSVPQRYWDLAGRCTVAADAPEDGIADALTSYVDGLVARKSTAVGWITTPVLDQVRTVTERSPMTLAGDMPLMCRNGAPGRDDRPAYAGTVARITDPSLMGPALVVMGKAFDVDPAMLELELSALLDRPEMALHVAQRDGTVESMCLTYRDGSDCYVYVMATDPERQRQGAGRAVLQQTMEEAVADGVERFGLLASSAGEPLYRSMGYATVETAGFWIINPQ